MHIWGSEEAKNVMFNYKVYVPTYVARHNNVYIIATCNELTIYSYVCMYVGCSVASSNVDTMRCHEKACVEEEGVGGGA